MSIEFFEPEWTFGDLPAAPVASDIALEASTSEINAQAMLGAAWEQAEAWTDRTYRATNTGKAIIKVLSPIVWTWPRFPFPPSLTIERYSQGSWVPHSETYIPDLGMIELEPFTLYRLSHSDPVPGASVSSAVKQAVHNLTLYQLIQSPARREFQSQSAGDSGLTRERLMNVFLGSGAGAMLAGEVRL